MFIDSLEEDTYLRETFFEPNGEVEFWISLNDMEREGMFRYVGHSHSTYAMPTCCMLQVAHW